jgi:hypothetical protein
MLTLAFAFASVGCDPKVKQGPPGADGGRIKSSIYCSGTISGLSGNAGTALNGIDVEYNAVLTAAGDVYATANIIEDYVQVSGTQFYAAAESGSSTGEILITDDLYGGNGGGYFKISLNRTTMITSIVYTDANLGGQSPVNLQFTPAACDIGNW